MSKLSSYLNKHTEAAPLAAFRILFGLLMVISLIRFWYHGWIEKLYLTPSFHFSYYGLDFIEVPGQWTYLLFILCGLSALGLSLGYLYRSMSVIFFLSFTYIELMDKTTYLNHYYFVSILSFLMIWLPAHRYYSIDAHLRPALRAQYVPQWTIDSIKLLLAVVYIYAGLAKLNYDWIVQALPLKIWLPTKMHIPLLGDWLNQEWVFYAFSWGGAAYDLSIVFFLLYKRTRVYAFAMVVIFHLLTRVLFQIGMFPYIMIFATLIFFDASLHRRILASISIILGTKLSVFDNGIVAHYRASFWSKIRLGIVSLFFILQLLVPLRFLLYPDHLFWTEEGYRFSWRVMLMEKTGYAQFKIVNGNTGRRFYVNNQDFLNSLQEKQMSTQADMILEYAHYLGNHFASQGHEHVEVYVESYASLNGRGSQPYVDPTIDLMSIEPSLKHKSWILPLND